MKYQCCVCKSTDPDMIPYRWGVTNYPEYKNVMYCSPKCLLTHRNMAEPKQRTGLIACFYHKIMVISRCIHRLITNF